jgi:hypothetical protein
LRILRHVGALCFLAGAEFVLMSLLEFFYFRNLAGGQTSLDLRFTGFSLEDMLGWLSALGPQGAQVLLVWHYLTFDLLFPVLLSLALASLIVWHGKKLPRFSALSETGRGVFALALVAPYCLLDYAQNFAVARLLADPQKIDQASVSLASGLITAKFAFGVIPFAVIALFALAGQKKH